MLWHVTYMCINWGKLSYKQPGNEASCKHELVNATRVCWSVHEMRSWPNWGFCLRSPQWGCGCHKSEQIEASSFNSKHFPKTGVGKCVHCTEMQCSRWWKGHLLPWSGSVSTWYFHLTYTEAHLLKWLGFSKIHLQLNLASMLQQDYVLIWIHLHSKWITCTVLATIKVWDGMKGWDTSTNSTF